MIVGEIHTSLDALSFGLCTFVYGARPCTERLRGVLPSSPNFTGASGTVTLSTHNAEWHVLIFFIAIY
jgi:hypothetical protein